MSKWNGLPLVIIMMQVMKGTIIMPDLSTDACGDYEVNVKVKSASIPDDLRSNIVKTDGIFKKKLEELLVFSKKNLLILVLKNKIIKALEYIIFFGEYQV